MANPRIHSAVLLAFACIAGAAMAQTNSPGKAPNAPGAGPATSVSAPAAPAAAPHPASDASGGQPVPGVDRKSAQWQKELEELERLKEAYRKIEEQRTQLNKAAAEAAVPATPAAPAAPTAQPAAAAPASAEAASAAAKEPPKVEIPAMDTLRIVSGSEEKLANALYTLGRYNEALDAYERAAGTATDAESQSWILYQSGMCSLKLGHADKALEKLGQAISKRPDTTWAKQAQWQINAMRWSARWPSRIAP